MSPQPDQSSPVVRSRTKLLWHQDRELFDTQHRVICNIGGFGSGKTFNDFLILLDRSRWDTGQRFGLFANTDSQVTEGILPKLEELCQTFGIETAPFGAAPPKAWKRMWDARGIPYPQRGPRSPHTWIWKTGLHIVCGGISNGKFRRFKAYEFGGFIGEEITEWPNEDPFKVLIPRLRCGTGGVYCDKHHRHVAYLRGNPPDPRKPHWIRSWINEQKRREREAVAAGDAPRYLFLQSSTYDNVDNVGWDYIRTIRRAYDHDTAEAMLTGSIAQVSSSTTMYQWSNANVIPIAYDPQRPLHVAMDFNVIPSAATLGHELRDDEVPPEQRGKGLRHIGTFGEFATSTGLLAPEVATALLFGHKAKGGHWPDNFKGLIEHRHRVYMYGDASGKARRVEGAPAWTQVNALMNKHLSANGKYMFDVPGANPSIEESVSVLNGLILNDAGDRSYWVDPRCVELIADLEQVTPKPDGSEWIDKDKDDKRTHWLDPERYKVWQRYPEKRRSAVKNGFRTVPPTDDFPNLGTL